MDKVYEQQFKHSMVGAGPGREEKKNGEKSSWGSLGPVRSHPCRAGSRFVGGFALPGFVDVCSADGVPCMGLQSR